MSPTEILDQARGQGVELVLVSGKLKAAPPGRLSPDLRESILEHADEIKALLALPNLPPLGHPSYSIISTCQRHGIALRIDSDGTLVVGRAGARAVESTQPWRTLLRAIEAHAEAVAVLVAAGWHLRTGFPKEATA